MSLKSKYDMLKQEFDHRIIIEAQKLAREMYTRWINAEADRIRREAMNLAYR